MEVFGSPVVELTAQATGGWSRIVTVLSARTPAGKEIVVAGGGVPTRTGTRTYRVVLGNQATFLPRGSRLTLTIGSSSLAQNPGNLLYLVLPFEAAFHLHYALHWLLAFLAMHRLARELGQGDAAAFDFMRTAVVPNAA